MANKKRKVQEVSTELQLPPWACPAGLGPPGVRRPETGAPTPRPPPPQTCHTGSPLLCLHLKTDSEMPSRDPTVHIWGGPSRDHREVWPQHPLSSCSLKPHTTPFLKTASWGGSCPSPPSFSWNGPSPGGKSSFTTWCLGWLSSEMGGGAKGSSSYLVINGPLCHGESAQNEGDQSSGPLWPLPLFQGQATSCKAPQSQR